MDLEEQYDKLLRYCYMRLRDRTAAEDLTQEAFLRFLESKTYRNTGKELAYLYTIAGNLCIDYFRKRPPLPLEALPPETATREDEPKIMDRISIECAMDTLKAEEREAVMLRYSCGLSVMQIGKIMGISRFAVHRRLAGAMEKLRKEMQP